MSGFVRKAGVIRQDSNYLGSACCLTERPIPSSTDEFDPAASSLVPYSHVSKVVSREIFLVYNPTKKFTFSLIKKLF